MKRQATKPNDYTYKIIEKRNGKDKVMKTGLTYNEASAMMKSAKQYGIKLQAIAEV